MIQMLIFDLRHRLATLEGSQESLMMPLCFAKALVMTSFLSRQLVNVCSLLLVMLIAILTTSRCQAPQGYPFAGIANLTFWWTDNCHILVAPLVHCETQVVTFMSLRDRKKCVGGPIAVQSLSVVGAHVTQSTRPVIG